MTTTANAHERWIARMRSQGYPTSTYPCPACEREIDVITPTAELEPYDTMCDCPYCREMHYRTVWSDGSVEVKTGTEQQTERNT